MKKKLFIVVIGLIISIISLVFIFVYYKSNNRLTIYASAGSYAYKYAKNNMINTFDLSDSHRDYFERIWESFKFNAEGSNLAITKYEGISEELIIPTLYSNKKIVKIEKGALPDTVKKVFLPDSVTTIDYDDFGNKEILCYKGKFCEDLKANDKLKVTVLDDVDRYIVYEDDIEFTYNIKENEVELTNYFGKEEIVVIPKTINGYKVTSIKFDGAGISSIFIPDTVTSISGNITSKLLNKCFILSSIIIVVSFIIYVVSILITKVYERVDKVYVYFVSLAYLAVITYIVYTMRYNPFEDTKYMIYCGIVSVIYLIINFVLDKIIKNNKKFDEDIKHKNDFIKEAKMLLMDKEYKELDEIVEMIKYSDPVSINEVKNIEADIKETIKSINEDNVKESVKELKTLIKKRNAIIKDKK